MEKEFLSIKNFAIAAGVSEQSIYKRLKDKENELQAFVKTENGKRVISAAALTAIYEKPLHQATEPPEESSINKVIEILQQQLEAQRIDIENKNLQIERLSQQLEKEQESLQREQQLHLIASQKVLALEAAAKEEAEAAAAAPIVEKKRKGFFSMFRRKESE